VRNGHPLAARLAGGTVAASLEREMNSPGQMPLGASAPMINMHADLTSLWASHDESTDPSRTIVSAEYLEVIATRA
jgi:hypothetical protein